MGSEWVRACATVDVLPGESCVVWDGDTAILVVNLDGHYYAVEDRCTHDEYELSAGPVNVTEGSIECLLHGARFDLRDGSALCAPAHTPVASFPVRVEDGVVWTRDDRD